MGSRTVIMIGLAGIFAAIAIFAGRAWLEKQAASQMGTMEKVQPVATTTLVVASSALRFGTRITDANVREIPWPSDAIPAGAFSKVADLVGKEPRIVLSGLEANEPVLASKITGPGARATLSALIEPDKRAVTVSVNDVQGVGGFVLPGDRVDVVMTRQPDTGDSYSEMVLQNLKVLAVDQLADDRRSEPIVVKAVTLEVSADQAQRLTLAESVGTLSLALRAAGHTAYTEMTRVSVRELGAGPKVASSDTEKTSVRATLTVGVTRGSERKDYVVPAERPVTKTARRIPMTIQAPPIPVAAPARDVDQTAVPVSAAGNKPTPRG
ncbi:MAG TPA: Flp pilus assembly protein CpaB [Rhodobacteraceae bacterium]|nr:Flp pilus assembly protein CpaB [Paracoccaceae bacterium]